jgi:Flp pilus assembly protein CpaB
MEASSSSRKRTGGGLTGAMFSTRRGAITTAIVAAILAGLLIFAFVSSYTKSGAAAPVNTPVFVSQGFIPRGTPATVVASNSLLDRTTVPSTHVVVGAISDPATLKGEVAVQDIYPGQQITAADFAVGNVSVASQLTGVERAISVPVDTAHGLIGFVHSGDHVDVLASLTSGGGGGQVTTLATNIVVLNAPSGGAGGVGSSSSGGDIVLRATPKEASAMAYAADNGKIWIVLRPPVGAIGTTTATTQGTSGK